MKQEKKLILGMIVLAFFVLIVSVSSLYVQLEISSGNACGCAIPLPLFIPFLASIGLFIGTLLYHFFFPKNVVGVNKEPILKLLTPPEKEIVNKLLENEGRCLQSKLTRETNLSKVQVFRTLEELLRKGIIKKEPYGKTNTIKLDRELFELFKS